MTYTIGIDSSTTATKAVLVRADGEVAGVATSTYAAESPHPLWSEQHPDLWWQATQEAIRNLLDNTGANAADVAGVGLTGQMHGLVLLDAAGTPLRPAILWNDQRTAAECDEIRTIVGAERFIRITGNDALTGFTAPKLLWVRNQEPEIYARAAHVLLPKDYVRLRLTGTYATDRAGGGGTVLFDHKARTWSPAILDALEIPPAWMPPTFEGPEITGTITEEAATATGLRAGTPVVAGGGDQAATAVGTGAIDPGVLTVSLGTSGVVFAATTQPVIDPAGSVHAFPHAVPARWHLMGVTLAAAGSLAWLRDTAAPGTDFAALSAAAERVASGSDGLVFLPYLSGERTPHNDPLARGAFVGLTVRHEIGHLTRAVMEGVAFSLRDVLEVMLAVGVERPEQVRISGGGARSPLWRQIVADTLQAEVATVNTTEGAAFGAAMLAAVGTELVADAATAAKEWVRVVDSTRPAASSDDGYAVYRSLYPALRDAMHTLSNSE
ncbi:MAG TPA: xylulokinase [Acidimicrobiia bacterium]|jgi:xylulokinase|nr:xylulokinase [Acidimicrobiia bacterium]